MSIDGLSKPILFVNGQPARLSGWPIQRPDVNAAFGLPGDFGFSFDFEGVMPGDTIELFTFRDQKLIALDSKITQDKSTKTCIYDQIFRAKKISIQPGSVAITCWDGGHNPIGRANVLYQTVAEKRPALIIAYQFEQFSSSIWGPLSDSVMDHVLIPWTERQEYLKLMRLLKIEFSTIWMCKSRLPTFELASNFTGENTKLILDHDDNERHFENATRKDYFYGANTSSLAKYLTSKISSHTAASVPLAEEFKAEIVRHARSQNALTSKKIDVRSPIKIGFIGTVRKHKGLENAAKALKIAGWMLGLNIEFHVQGAFESQEVKSILESHGVISGGEVSSSNLLRELRKFDIVLTGFPTNSEDDEKINTYQISSKIGDALAVGLPVLVPLTPSTQDLSATPGVFLFEIDNFSQAISAVLKSLFQPSLPYEFTYKGAYSAFVQAESLASTEPVQFELIRTSEPIVSFATSQKTLVLLWKQNDAGLYGRRVDQIARSFKEVHPDFRVIVLELCHATTKSAFYNQSVEFSGDGRFISSLIADKSSSVRTKLGAVEYMTIAFDSSKALSNHFLRFVTQNGLTPSDTTFIVFPIINFFDCISPLLSKFRIVLDIVDNQFSWANDEVRSSYAEQYAYLFRMAEVIVFNSGENRKFFSDGGFFSRSSCNPENILTIPNWYQAVFEKDSDDFIATDKGKDINFLFSGNLNDRVDWGLLREVASVRKEVVVHIVGNGRRQMEEIREISRVPNIVYWGPLPENKVRILAKICHAGLVPHLIDGVSKFMNPMKVQMYLDLNLPTLSTELPGVEPVEGVYVCPTKETFLDQVREFVDNNHRGIEQEVDRNFRLGADSPSKMKYMHLLNQTFSNKEE